MGKALSGELSCTETGLVMQVVLTFFRRDFRRDTRPRGCKTFFMLNSDEHGILNVNKYKKYQEIRYYLDSDKPRMLFFLLINVNMPTIVGILTFMSRKNFLLS